MESTRPKHVTGDVSSTDDGSKIARITFVLYYQVHFSLPIAPFVVSNASETFVEGNRCFLGGKWNLLGQNM